MLRKVLLAHPPHFLEPGVIGGGCLGAACELAAQPGPEAGARARVGFQIGRQPVPGVAATAFLGDQRRVAQQSEVSGNAGLGNSENGCEFGDVERLEGKRPQQPQAHVVAKQPQE